MISRFEYDRSAARGEMATRGLYVFEHDSPLGRGADAQAARASSRETFRRSAIGRSASAAFDDYRVEVDEGGVPEGVRLLRLLD